MDAPPSKDGLTLGVAVASILSSILAGVCAGTWTTRGYVSRIEKTEAELEDLKKIVFLDKGGLNLLTLDAHALICQTNQQLFGKDLEAIRDIVERIAQKDELVAIKQSLKSIESTLAARTDNRGGI